MSTPISILLNQKGSRIISVLPSASVADAVRVMIQHRVGSVVVLEDGRMTGIFTERDMLNRVAVSGRTPESIRVEEVMTRHPLTVRPETGVEQVMALFTDRRCRHLPVVDESSGSPVLTGMISIGDVTRWLLESYSAETENLRRYIGAS
ncbi:CBS domain-containing protein [Termitidicoccus mucosus]|uniref:CBS domain-containing protein n=1 Tax=Termitidicoccus mucosus TaxID=1184151 RepID=A0A178IP95_9BACT|nr:hypothetical protein AW736_04645 [Opitutaceae bacterium TSB47]